MPVTASTWLPTAGVMAAQLPAAAAAAWQPGALAGGEVSPATAGFGSVTNTQAAPAAGVPPGSGPLTQEGVLTVAPGKWTATTFWTVELSGSGEVARPATRAPSRAASPATA